METLLEAERRRTGEVLDRVSSGSVIVYASSRGLFEASDGQVTIDAGLYVRQGASWVLPEATAGESAAAAYAREVVGKILESVPGIARQVAMASFPSLGHDGMAQLQSDMGQAVAGLAPAMADAIVGILTQDTKPAVDLLTPPAVGLNVGKIRSKYAAGEAPKARGEALHG